MTDPALAGLESADVEHLYAAARAIRDRDEVAAAAHLNLALAHAPHHAEALRLRSILELQQGDPRQALTTLEFALGHAPTNAALLAQVGNVHSACGNVEAAIAAWRAALAADARLAPAWFNLGRAAQTQGDSTAAAEAFAHVRALQPDFVPAAILHGDTLLHLGDLAAAASAYRTALKLQPGSGDAWRGLANLKTVPLTAADAAQMGAQLARSNLTDRDRVLIELALGKYEEDHGQLDAALAAFTRGNSLQRRLTPWSGAALHDYVTRALAATGKLPVPQESQLGREVIFIVGLPRSGSTLFEQILAAHPEVAGASELSDLGIVLEEESRRRRRRYPAWVPAATNEDWRRLGLAYLARTARWRRDRPHSTDKLPENWKHVGILRAMLPGATVIETRRDWLETAWSCFKQPFYTQPHFANDFADLATCIAECVRAMDAWRARDPAHVHLYRYEDLIATPEAAIRRLLTDCGLAFDAACLDFRHAARSVRTASAAQVRQPLHAVEGRAAAYGALLQPLRDALREAGITDLHDRVGSRNLPAPSHTTVRAVPHTAVHE